MAKERDISEVNGQWKNKFYGIRHENIEFVMYLNDGKVAKRFGPRPWLGKLLPLARRIVTVGVKWSLPHLDFIPDENVMITPTIRLRPLAKGKWMVNIDPSYRREVEQYLIDFCM